MDTSTAPQLVRHSEQITELLQRAEAAEDERDQWKDIATQQTISLNEAMTPREENEVLAQWAGIECQCGREPSYGSTLYWRDCPRHSNNDNPPDYGRDGGAITLLSKLNELGYRFELNNRGKENDYTLEVWIKPQDGFLAVVEKPTIAAAIKAAVLQLIEQVKTV
jgi:hypothetical protein